MYMQRFTGKSKNENQNNKLNLGFDPIFQLERELNLLQLALD